jgi:hypothetical protein
LEEISGDGVFEGEYSSAEDPMTLKCGAEEIWSVTVMRASGCSETHLQMLCDWCEKYQLGLSHFLEVNK